MTTTELRTTTTAATATATTAGRHRLAVLPPVLREAASDLSAKPGYDRLWPAVEGFKTSAGLPGAANLVQFMKHFDDELDSFVAEFESVEGQIGAGLPADPATRVPLEVPATGEALAGIRSPPSPRHCAPRTRASRTCRHAGMSAQTTLPWLPGETRTPPSSA